VVHDLSRPLDRCGYSDTMDAGPGAPPSLRYTHVPCTQHTDGKRLQLLLTNGANILVPVCAAHADVLQSVDVAPAD
jgi:hypothetical protein